MTKQVFKKIEKELRRISTVETPVFLDTGALIDLQSLCSCRFMFGRDIGKCLNQLEEYGDFLVPAETIDEIREHANVVIGEKTREISPLALGKAVLYHDRFHELYSQLDRVIGEEQALANWLLINGEISDCLNQIKQDHVSRADKKILECAVNLVSIPRFNLKPYERAIILTSDKHVGTGCEMLRHRGYPLYTVLTRI